MYAENIIFMPKNFSIFDHTPELEKLTEMIFVEHGPFKMGNNDDEAYGDEKDIQDITIKNSFYIGKYPITQLVWKEVMGTENNPSYLVGDKLPVENVSWDDAKEFIDKLNIKTRNEFCLPSEAEWEFAARGGNKNNESKYAGSEVLNEVGWFNENSHDETKRVGLKMANELGIHDMNGNVWEWCEDDYHKSYKGVPNDGSAWIDKKRGTDRVVRGGSWLNHDRNCCVSFRFNHTPESYGSTTGFRLALSLS